jgi:PhnB protein
VRNEPERCPRPIDKEKRLPTITAHIIVRDAARAADWYAQALGAETGARIRVPDGRYMQIELHIGDSQLMIADEFPEMGAISPQTLGGTYGALTVAVDDAEAAWQRALDAGADVFHELEDAFWGERHGQFIDPFGHRWGVTQRLEEIAPEEVERRAAVLFGAPADKSVL